jgi:hypothetical protein
MLPFDRRRGVFGGHAGIPLPIFLCFRAYFHQAIRDGVYAMPGLAGHDRKHEICPADIGLFSPCFIGAPCTQR